MSNPQHMDLDIALEVIQEAKDYTDLYPVPDHDAIKRSYRAYARVVHPDRNRGLPAAVEAFNKLTNLHADAHQALDEGKFGQPLTLVTIRTKRATHVVRNQVGVGDIATLYTCETTVGGGKDIGFLKIAKTPKDNDLMNAEAAALKTLHEDGHVLQRHVPRLLDKFVYQGSRGVRRRANVQEWHPGITLHELRAAYPKGIDPRHAVWIWRRLLMALGFAHDRGVLHGAVLPQHVLIGPQTHAVMLLDWCYSRLANTVDKGKPIVALARPPGDRSWYYPTEVFDKKAPTVATDLYMAARVMQDLLGGGYGVPSSAPRPLRAYFNGCTLETPSMRPQNAWVLLAEFDELLERIGEPFHPRRYLELAVPAGTA